MTNTKYPLLKLLMLTADTEKSVELSCSDCFALLDYDAGLLTSGGDLDDLLPVIKHHLSICSSCQEELKSWLDELNGNIKPINLSFRIKGEVPNYGNRKSGN
jgi:hypothetical protein